MECSPPPLHPSCPEHRGERKQALAQYLPSYFPAHRTTAIVSGRYPHRVRVNPPAAAGGPVPRPKPESHGWLGAHQPQLCVPGVCRSVYAITTSASRSMVASPGPCGVGVRRSAITWPKPNWMSIRRSDHARPEAKLVGKPPQRTRPAKAKLDEHPPQRSCPAEAKLVGKPPQCTLPAEAKLIGRPPQRTRPAEATLVWESPQCTHLAEAALTLGHLPQHGCRAEAGSLVQRWGVLRGTPRVYRSEEHTSELQSRP